MILFLTESILKSKVRWTANFSPYIDQEIWAVRFASTSQKTNCASQDTSAKIISSPWSVSSRTKLLILSKTSQKKSTIVSYDSLLPHLSSPCQTTIVLHSRMGLFAMFLSIEYLLTCRWNHFKHEMWKEIFLPSLLQYLFRNLPTQTNRHSRPWSRRLNLLVNTPTSIRPPLKPKNRRNWSLTRNLLLKNPNSSRTPLKTRDRRKPKLWRRRRRRRRRHSNQRPNLRVLPQHQAKYQRLLQSRFRPNKWKLSLPRKILSCFMVCAFIRRGTTSSHSFYEWTVVFVQTTSGRSGVSYGIAPTVIVRFVFIVSSYPPENITNKFRLHKASHNFTRISFQNKQDRDTMVVIYSVPLLLSFQA